MIEVKNLSVQVGTYAINRLSLRVESGEYFVLLGPSGAGKTVLIETILGIHNVREGSVHVGGDEVTHVSPEERHIGYIPQDFGLFPHLNVRDNILFGARARKLSLPVQEQRLAELSRLLEITPLLDRPDIVSLSGGERQRVAIARALIIEPKALIIDEPFSSIDEFLKIQLQKKLLEIKRAMNVTILHVTHDHHEAFYMGDRIGVLLNGRLHQVGETKDLYFRPQTIEVARFLLTRNMYAGEVVEAAGDQTEVRIRLGTIQLRAHACQAVAPGQKIYAGIRPEEIKIDLLPADWKVCDEDDCNAFAGVIRRKIERFLSFHYEVEIDALKPNLEIEAMRSRFCGTALQEGVQVKVCLSRKSLWVLPRE